MTTSREELDRRLDRLVARVEELGERLGVPTRSDEKNTWWLQPRAPAGNSDGGQWTAEDGGAGSAGRSQSRFGHWLRTGRDSLTGQSTPSMTLTSSPTPAQAPAGAWQDPYPASRISPAFREAIAAREARGVPGGGYEAYNQGSRALGRYQLKPNAQEAAGLRNADGSWNANNRFGVRTPEEFLANPVAQEQALQAYLNDNARQLERNGSMSQVGQTIVGVSGRTFAVTESGLAAAAHREGAPTVGRYIAFMQRHGWRNSHAALRGLPQGLRESFLHIETRLREFEHVPYRP